MVVHSRNGPITHSWLFFIDARSNAQQGIYLLVYIWWLQNISAIITLEKGMETVGPCLRGRVDRFRATYTNRLKRQSFSDKSVLVKTSISIPFCSYKKLRLFWEGFSIDFEAWLRDFNNVKNHMGFDTSF